MSTVRNTPKEEEIASTICRGRIIITTNSCQQRITYKNKTNLLLNSFSSDITQTETPTDSVDNTSPYITDMSFVSPEANFCFFSDTINDKEEWSGESSFASPEVDYSTQWYTVDYASPKESFLESLKKESLYETNFISTLFLDFQFNFENLLYYFVHARPEREIDQTDAAYSLSYATPFFELCVSESP